MTGLPASALGPVGRAETRSWVGVVPTHDPTAKKSGKKPRLGDDGGGGAAEGLAQAYAHNQLVTSLLQGQYDGHLDDFYDDLESILEWDDPTWIPPDPASPCGFLPLNECGPIPDRPRKHFVDVPIVEPGTLFVFDDSYTGCEQDLIGHAWGLLLENVDILDWVVCVSERLARQNGAAFQTDSPHTCLRSAVEGTLDREGRPAWVTFTKNEESPQCKMGAIGSRNEIYMCVNGERKLFNVAVDLYCNGTDTQRRCAVFAMAASLLHELSHTGCGFEHDDEDGDIVPCSIPYLIGSTFAAVIMARYPEIASSPCCRRYRKVRIGGSKKLPGFTDDCEASQ